MTYREKTIWGALLTTVAFCGWILWRSHRGDSRWSMIGPIFLLCMIHIAYSIVIALVSRREPADERDKVIEYKSFKAGYFILFGCGFTWLALGHLYGITSVAQIPMAMLFLAILGCAEIARLGFQLVLYRTGVSQ